MDEFDGQLSLFDYDKTHLRITKPIRVIELFAGIGSQLSALKHIGADAVSWKMVEIDKFACNSYNAIHGTNYSPTDITQIHGSDLEIKNTIDFTYLLTYSFPCTDISSAGKMQGYAENSGTRSSLLWQVRRLLSECEELPQVLLMENVPGVHSQANMPHFIKWLNFLESLGYSNSWADLNAKDYGVPQSRNRCFVVSCLGEHSYKFPLPIPLEKTMKDCLEDNPADNLFIRTENAHKLIDKLIRENKILQTADSRQQTADSRQQTADSRQQTADSNRAFNVCQANHDCECLDGERGQRDFTHSEARQRSDRDQADLRECWGMNYIKIEKPLTIAKTLLARSSWGGGLIAENGVLEIKEING